MTPGGGGYGKAGEKSQVEKKEDYEKNWTKGSLASHLAEWESSS
jgi:N-methylhydantoinase B/oxoprolinase/acetone carboxylase alpha subunit